MKSFGSVDVRSTVNCPDLLTLKIVPNDVVLLRDEPTRSPAMLSISGSDGVVPSAPSMKL